jgi:uncharacterized protein
MSERERLVEIVRATPWLMHALEEVRSIGAPDACIGAGAVRATVWDALHGYTVASAIADVDVAYFDPADLSIESQDEYRRKLADLLPDFVWDVVNQASVHLWYEQVFGCPVAPLRSVEEGVASWPETATAVGVSMDDAGRIRVIDPCGLSDLFQCVVRRNAIRVTTSQFRERVVAKRYTERWPKASVVWA